MAVIYAPLALQAYLNSMPQNYAKRLPKSDGTGLVTSQQHIDRMNDFSGLEEVNDDAVKIRLFSQSLMGEVNKWYMELPTRSMVDLPQLHQFFITRWETKKYPFQILNE